MWHGGLTREQVRAVVEDLAVQVEDPLNRLVVKSGTEHQADLRGAERVRTVQAATTA